MRETERERNRKRERERERERYQDAVLRPEKSHESKLPFLVPGAHG